MFFHKFEIDAALHGKTCFWVLGAQFGDTPFLLLWCWWYPLDCRLLGEIPYGDGHFIKISSL
jgi:hypothetical protein